MRRILPDRPDRPGAFLDSIAADRFGPLFDLVAATGLRRGEAVGLRWADVDLARGVLVVRQQLVVLSGTQPLCAYCGGQHLGAPQHRKRLRASARTPEALKILLPRLDSNQ